MTLPPIRREIIVDADPDQAFRVFTDGIGRWWPVAEHSVFGAGSSVAFEDGVIVETSAAGQRAEWGSVTRWEPGRALAFTWYPGHGPERATAVEVTFAAHGARTLVTLQHSGWEVYADPAAARDEYEHGWPTVAAGFAALVGEEAEWTWVALVHSPAPGVTGSVFADARFAEHVAFLQRMSAAGWLVAAGPLADSDGGGMTVVRLPGSDRLDEVRALATEDDRSVADGLFTVAVRPWQVMMHLV